MPKVTSKHPDPDYGDFLNQELVDEFTQYAQLDNPDLFTMFTEDKRDYKENEKDKLIEHLQNRVCQLQCDINEINKKLSFYNWDKYISDQEEKEFFKYLADNLKNKK